MHIIDTYAYSNRLRRVDPAHKTILALAIMLLCLALNNVWVSLAAICEMFFLLLIMARISAKVVMRVLLAELSFFVLATLGVVLSFSLEEPLASVGWQPLAVGPIWVSTSPDQLALGLNLILRALAAASAMNFLALTTPMVDLVDLLRRWHLPPLLIDLMTLMYRFIFTLLDSLNRMVIAQDCRLGYSSKRRSMVSAALVGSHLFMDVFQRSRRLQLALEARGYSGELRVLPTNYQRYRQFGIVGSLMVMGLIVVWIIQ